MTVHGVLGDCRKALSRVAHPWRRAEDVPCGDVAGELHAWLDDGASASPALVWHVENCLPCQAELARYRRLLRLMHQLQSNDVVVPPGIVGDVLAAVEAAASRQAIRSVLTGRRLGYGGAVVGAVGAGTGIVLLASVVARRRSGQMTPSASSAAYSLSSSPSSPT